MRVELARYIDTFDLYSDNCILNYSLYVFCEIRIKAGNSLVHFRDFCNYRQGSVYSLAANSISRSVQTWQSTESSKYAH